MKSKAIGYSFYYPKYLTIEENGECFVAKCPYCGEEKLNWSNWYMAKIEAEELRVICENCKKEFTSEEIEKGKYLGRIEDKLKKVIKRKEE